MSVYHTRRKRPAGEAVEQPRSEWLRAIEIATRELPATPAATIDDLRSIPSWPLVSQLLYAKSAKTRDLNAEALLRVVNDRPATHEGPAVEGLDPPLASWSPRALPNFESAYRECVAALKARHEPLVYEAVAFWLQEKYDLPRRLRQKTDSYADLHAKTVAGWVKRAGLPPPSKL